MEISLTVFLMQPLDVILSQDHNQIVALLEYVRYDFQPQIQLYSIKILSILRQLLHILSPLYSYMVIIFLVENS